MAAQQHTVVVASSNSRRPQPKPQGPVTPRDPAARRRGRPRKIDSSPALAATPKQQQEPRGCSPSPKSLRKASAMKSPSSPRSPRSTMASTRALTDAQLFLEIQEWERALEFDVYRRQTVHEPQVQRWNNAYRTSMEEEDAAEAKGGAPKKGLELQQQRIPHQQPEQQQRRRRHVRLSASTQRIMRAERRRQRREEGFAAIAASRGVEPEAVLLAADKRRSQRNRIRQAVLTTHAPDPTPSPSSSSSSSVSSSSQLQQQQQRVRLRNNTTTPGMPVRSFYLKPRGKKLTRAEELELVQTWQAWKEAERRGRLWASEAPGRRVTPEAMAALLGCSASEVRLLQRDAVAAHQEIQSSFIGLVNKLANAFDSTGMNHTDLVTEGLRGLDTGLLKFDASRGNRLSTVAVWWIRNALYKANSNQARAVRLPTCTVEQMQKVSRAIDRLGHSDVSALVEATGLTRASVKRIVGLVLRQSECSLDAPAGGSGSGGGMGPSSDSPMSLHELLDDTAAASGGGADGGVMTADGCCDAQNYYGFLDAMGEALVMLPPREAYVLRRFFGLDNGAKAKLVDIARELSVAPSRVSQIRNEALTRLRCDQRFKHLEEYMPQALGSLS